MNILMTERATYGHIMPMQLSEFHLALNMRYRQLFFHTEEHIEMKNRKYSNRKPSNNFPEILTETHETTFSGPI